jgi:hypothetical protein
MKIPSFRKALLAVAAGAVFFTSADSALAQLNIQVGPGGPPPGRPEHRWHEPYRGAYWVRGHHEWRGGQWVWIGGYYDYPPYPGAVWIEGHVGRDGNWRPGHWSHR